MKKTILLLFILMTFGVSVHCAPSARNAFPGLIPSTFSVLGFKFNFVYDENDRLQDISGMVNFDYSEGEFDGFSYDASMIIDDEESQIACFFQTNDMGYITHCYALESEDGYETEISTWDIEYDEDGHITYLKRGGWDESEVYVTYEGGNAVELTYTDGFFGSIYPALIITPEYKDSILNVSGMMNFDAGIGLPLDILGTAYYAGMLGKPTTLMPTGFKTNEGSSCRVVWTLRDDGYPTSMSQYDDGELDIRMSLTWQNGAGVPNTVVDSGDTSTRYFDIMGNRVDKPQAGNIYIRVKNGIVSKFLCK